jgi:hypothetical protein
VSSVHNRWELVEPLLFAHSLRAVTAFRTGSQKCSARQDLETIRREHRFEDTAVAQAFLCLDHEAPSFRDSDESIHAAICKTSARWLSGRGDHWALSVVPGRAGHEIVRWRGVTMLIPPSIVIAGALAKTERVYPRSVQVLPDSIAPIEPVRHLHMHLGPMLPFEALWAQLWAVFLRQGTLDSRPGKKQISALSGEQVPEIGRSGNRRQPGARWQWILELAFAARLWLMEEETPTTLSSVSADNDRTYREERDNLLVIPSVLRAFARGLIDPDQRARSLRFFSSSEMFRARAKMEAHRELGTRRRVDGSRIEPFGAASADRSADRTDVVANPPRDGDDEVVFLARSLRRCGSDDAYEKRYAAILYQYLRVKVALYGRLVVDPWTIGLRHFLDVVKRDEAYADVIGDSRILDELRLRGGEAEKPLRIEALEIHVPPERWIKQTLPRFGRHAWVLSFIRARVPGTDDPQGSRGAEDWRRATTKAGTTCRLLARWIDTRPWVLRKLRGLSLMDWERNGPVWLFSRPFRRLLDASIEAAASHPRLNLRPIQTAFHLGEDFDHLLTGLREIFEPFQWGLIQAGDRIGHALALGLSPEKWCEQNPWIRMRPWDRILDTGFIYWALDRLAIELDAGQIERMRLQASDAFQCIFNERPPNSLDSARNLWLSLPGLPARDLSGVKRSPDDLATAQRYLDRIRDERLVGRTALTLSLAVETRSDLPMLKAIHAAVHNRVARAMVAVEVNPSSNLLVGGFRCIFEQPVFHTSNIPITLNADDPLTFATTLADDYAYAWAGMVVGAGESPHLAARRLDEAARCSRRFAFTAQGTRDRVEEGTDAQTRRRVRK